MNAFRIGTRGSALALWQAHHIRERLGQECGAAAEIVVIKTSGDRFDAPKISEIGVKGVFIKELEDALLDDRIDLAVHSMKDVPTAIPQGLAFPAICRREDARDALVARSGAKLDELPAGARVGTSSLRRQSQLRHHRPDLDVRDLRGNVDTRLRRAETGEYDAIVLAKAGLDRLGLSGRITEVLSTDVSLPAVGQGALAIEARAANASVANLLARLDDTETRAGITAERSLLAELEGGCQVPLGAWGRVVDNQLVLEACVLSLDGADYLRKRASGGIADAEAIGRRLAKEMRAAGADRILRLAGRAVGEP